MDSLTRDRALAMLGVETRAFDRNQLRNPNTGEWIDTGLVKRIVNDVKDAFEGATTRVDWRGIHITAPVRGQPVTVTISPIDLASLALLAVPGAGEVGAAVEVARAAIVVRRIRQALAVAKAAETVAGAVKRSGELDAEERHRLLALLGIEVRDYNPALHPHAPAGGPHGGEFISSHGIGSALKELLTDDPVGALTGQDALDAVPTEYRSGPRAHFGDYDGATFTGPDGHGSEQALAEYEGVEYDRTNSYLRNGPMAGHPEVPADRLESVRQLDAENAARVAEIDKTMAVSRTAAPVQVERVIKAGRSVFGPAWHEGVMNDSTKDFDEQDREYERWLAGDRPDLTGASWLDQGYTSTTANPAFAEAFGERWARTARDMPSAEGEPVIMTITVPEGTGAIQLGNMGTTTGPNGRELLNSAELMLQRGLKFTVVADHGVDDKGFRRVDVVASHD